MSSVGKPNIVLLFTDQQRRDTIAAAGAKWMQTPHLDALVESGTLFTHGYSPNPVCVPARHCLLTGHNCDATGYYHNASGPMRYPGIPTYPQLLSDAGYYCGGVGKQHFVPDNRAHGFSELHLMEEILEHRENDAYAKYLEQEGFGEVRNLHGVRPALYHQPQTAQMPLAHHGTTWVGKTSVDFIRRNAYRPFYLMASFIHPHPPWDIPSEREGMYAEADLPAASPPRREKPFFQDSTPRYGDTDSAAQHRAEREAYYTSISMVDEAIGTIIAELKAQGVWDNTIIIFTSDHGEMLQDKGFYQKALPYEAASGIPFIVRAPEHLAPGTVRHDFVDLIDLMPTFLDIAGVDYQPYSDNERYAMPGSSLLRLDQAGGRDRSQQFVHNGTSRYRWLMQCNHRYKYIWWYNGGVEEFYDLANDPNEENNLAPRIHDASQLATEFNALKNACFANEYRYGPADMRDDQGFPKVYPYEPFGEQHWEGSKHPFWANTQFQQFGRLSPENEGRLFVEEAVRAVGDIETLKAVYSAPDLNATLEKHYRKLGGDQAPPLWHDGKHDDQ